jgi:hypothetical protein
MASQSVMLKFLVAIAAVATFIHIAMGAIPQKPTFEEIEAGMYQKP